MEIQQSPVYGISRSTATRDHSIDTAKGILIIMVVFAHCFTSGVVHDFFFAFHMPAFFVLSGLTSRLSNETSRPAKQIVSRMIITIGVPYVFFELLGTLQYFIRFGFGQNLKGIVYNSLTMQCNNIVDWFLYSLIITKLIHLVYFKSFTKSGNEKSARIPYLIVSIVLLFFAVLLPTTSPRIVSVFRTVFIAHGFYAIGYVLSELLQKKHSVLGVISLIIAFIISLLNTGYSDIYELHFGYPIAFAFAATLGTYGIIQISMMFSCRYIQYYGQNSLIIMGTHIPILLLSRFVTHVVTPTTLIRFADFVIILLLEIPIIWLIRNKAPFLIGKH